MEHQNGNVLFLLLIVIALFSALSFTVANMMRGASPETITDEKAGIYASEILDTARGLRQAVQNIRINGCADEDISFSNDIISGYAHAPTVSTSCQIFNSAGGAMTYTVPDPKWLANISGPPSLQGEWYFPANLCVEDVGSGSSGCDSDSTDNEDLVVILPYIRQDICETLNKRLNLGASALSTTGDAWPSSGDKFTGSYSDDTAMTLGTTGLISGCFEGDSGQTPTSGTYHFYQVLLAR